ncbi:cation:proton antiporter [Streptomyces sp. URMC 127]|uniref:cation:proton antiporter n=1 Tax=Streptomyces sp. URMC 127 TaxID=3423402 RepID=UPI003F1CAC0C
MNNSSPDAVILADIAVILLAGVAIGPLRARLRQPVVVGEIAVGLLLGPSLLGLLPGDLPGLIFPPQARPHLAAIAQVGIVLFMFVTGWELDFRPLHGRLRAVLALTTASLAVPFTLAVAVCAVLLVQRPAVTSPGTPAGVFVVFMGIVLTMGALSVLARIIKENGLHKSRAGTLAIACGALTEAVVWCALAALLTTVRGHGPAHGLQSLVQVLLYALAMACGVRPLLHRFLHWYAHRYTHRFAQSGRQGGGHPLLPVMVISSGVLLSSFATAWTGIHAVLGAFAFGLAMPRDLAPELRLSLEAPFQHTGALLIPVFFALTGLSVDVTGLGPAGAIELAAFLFVGCAGKYAGTLSGARLTGLPSREASVLGVLLNTRGLSEVIMLTIGRDAGIISGEVFTAMLLTALLATASVNPLVRALTTESSAGRPSLLPRAVPKQPVNAGDERITRTPPDEPAR